MVRDGHILDGNDLLLALDFHYSVNQQKWIAMRKNGLDLVDVQRPAGVSVAAGSACVQICGSLILKREL